MHPILIPIALSLSGTTMSDADAKVIDAWMYASTATATERESKVKLLFEHKPELAKQSKDGEPILEFALDMIGVDGDLGQRGALLAKIVVAKGGDVNAATEFGDPLLIHYGRFARIKAMKFLLEHGARPNAKDADDRTALHWVALLIEGTESGSQRIEQTLSAAKLLLDHKATIDARDKWGRTPLGSTAFLGNLRMTELLLGRGADMDSVDDDGYSVLGACKLRVEDTKDQPSFANHEERKQTQVVIDYLVKKGAKDVQQHYD